MNINKTYGTNDLPSYLRNAKSMGVIDLTDIRTILNATTSINIPGAGIGKNIPAHMSAIHNEMI